MQLRFSVLAFTLLLFGVTACMPNRLSGSLPDRAAPPPVAQASEEGPAVAPVSSGRNLQPQLETAYIDPDEVEALLPPDAIRAINPDEVAKIMVSADDADAAGMSLLTRVLGVSINGDSRAYPIPYMSSHEIVNDEVGGRLIAATW